MEQSAMDSFQKVFADESYVYTDCITHRGVVVAFAMTSAGVINYAVLNLKDGAPKSGKYAEKVSASADKRFWSPLTAPVPFPNEIEQVGFGLVGNTIMPKVNINNRKEMNKEMLQIDEIDPFLSSTARLGSKVPFKLFSDSHHIFIFRQSIGDHDSDHMVYALKRDFKGLSSGDTTRTASDFALDKNGKMIPIVNSTLLCDRFVLMGNLLAPRREARYQRSRNKTTPASPSDALDVKDMHDVPFFEPTHEMTFIENVSDGRFDIIQVPTSIANLSRWIVFAADKATGGVNWYTLEVSNEGLFNLQGSQLYTSPVDKYRFSVLERKPGICPFTKKALIPLAEESTNIQYGLIFSGDMQFAAAEYNIRTTRVYTVELWVKAIDKSHDITLFQSTTKNDSAALTISMSAEKWVCSHAGKRIELGPVELNEWRHIAVTCNGTAFTGTVGRVVQEKKMLTPDADQSDEDHNSILHKSILYISTAVEFQSHRVGCGVSDSNAFHGEIDELRIWERCLTTEEVLSSKNIRLTGKENSLLSYYNFDDGVAMKARDLASSGHHMTLSEQNMWIASDCVLQESKRLQKRTIRISEKMVSGPLSAKLYYEQEKVRSGYDNEEKPMQKNARVMVTFCSSHVSGTNGSYVTALDFGLSTDGQLAKAPEEVALNMIGDIDTGAEEMIELQRRISPAEDDIKKREEKVQSFAGAQAEIQRNEASIIDLRRYIQLEYGSKFFAEFKIQLHQERINSLRPEADKYHKAKTELDAAKKRLVELKKALAMKSKGADSSLSFPLDQVFKDPVGLSLRGAVLKFAPNADSLHLAVTASGRLALYFKDKTGKLKVVYFNTELTRAMFRLDKSSVSLFARESTSSFAGMTLQISDGSTKKYCNLVLRNANDTVNETWKDLPRDPTQFIDIINGSKPRVNATVVSTPRTLSSKHCSAYLKASQASKTTLVENENAVLIDSEPTGWISVVPGRCYNFQENTSPLSLDDRPTMSLGGTYTFEAWIKPQNSPSATPVIYQMNNKDIGFKVGLLKDGKPSSSDGTFSFNVITTIDTGDGGEFSAKKYVKSKQVIKSENWTHVAHTFQQTYGLIFAVDDYVEFEKADQLNIIGDLTIEASVYVQIFGGNIGVLQHGRLGVEGKEVPYQLSITERGLIEFSFEAEGSVKRFSSSRTIPTGRVSRIAVVRQSRQEEKEKSTSKSVTFTPSSGSKQTIEMDDLKTITYTDGADIKFFIDGSRAGETRYNDPAPLGSDDGFEIGRVHRSRSSVAGMKGAISEVRIWNVARKENEVSQNIDGSESGLSARFLFPEGRGRITSDAKSQLVGALRGPRWTKNPDESSLELKTYINGLRTSNVDCYESNSPVLCSKGDTGMVLGAFKNKGFSDNYYGSVEEVRVWRTIRSPEQISDSLFTRLRGDKKHLIANYTFDYYSTSFLAEKLFDASYMGNHIPISSSSAKPIADISTAPISDDIAILKEGIKGVDTHFQVMGQQATAVCEYADMQRDSTGKLTGAFKRCYSFISEGKWILLTGYKTGNLTTEWIGQAQYNPQVVGYVEGPPPLPAENFAQGAPDVLNSSVTFNNSKSVSYAISSSKEKSFDLGFEASMQYEAGTDDMLIIAPLGFGTAKKISEVSLGVNLGVNFDISQGWSDSRNVGTEFSNQTEMTARTVGTMEDDSSTQKLNPYLGNLKLFDNSGLAVVKSSTADVYALRLEHNNALVSLQMVPNKNIPADYNIISFPINPMYSKQGSLDGKVGFNESGAAVPMAPYPTPRDYGEYSYFKPKEALRLQRQIQRKQEQLKSYYQDTSNDLDSSILGGVLGTTAAAAVSVVIPGVGTAAAIAALAAGAYILSDIFSKDKISKTFSKRDLVNTYVWTSQGGFFAEKMETTDVHAEESAGEFSFAGSTGVGFHTDVEIFSIGFEAAMSASIGGSTTVTRTRSKEETQVFSLGTVLNVPDDLQFKKVNSKGKLIPQFDSNGKKILWPGKVDAYRYKTFYLDSDTSNFDDLFRKVVEPAWLANSTDPNAVAMRQARQSARKPPCWRIMHRVTFVSRVLPEFSASTAPSLEQKMAQINVGSNWELIQSLEPYVKPFIGSDSAFRTRVATAVKEVLPELQNYTEQIADFLANYYEVDSSIEGEADFLASPVGYTEGLEYIDIGNSDVSKGLELEQGQPSGSEPVIASSDVDDSDVPKGSELEYDQTIGPEPFIGSEWVLKTKEDRYVFVNPQRVVAASIEKYAMIKIENGLNGKGVSFSVMLGNKKHYFRHRNGFLQADTFQNKSLFKNDASFNWVTGLDDTKLTSFQSSNYPQNYFMRIDGRYKIHTNGPGRGPFGTFKLLSNVEK